MELMGEKPALNFLGEDLYSTGYQVYHKIKRGYRLPPLPDEFSIYGHAMEKYLDWKMQDHPDFDFKARQFIPPPPTFRPTRSVRRTAMPKADAAVLWTST